MRIPVARHYFLACLSLLMSFDIPASSREEAAGEIVLYSTTTQPAADREATLAIVGGSVITGADIHRAIAARLRQIEHQRYEILEKAVDRAVEQRLLEVEARARGISVDDLRQIEIEARLSEPPDEEIEVYYRANQRYINGSLETVASHLRHYLIAQQRRRLEAELMSRLRVKHGVQVFLGPFRTRVETAGFPSRGPDDAPVTIVAFSDFDCAACTHLEHTLDQIMADYGARVRLVFRQFPLAAHPYSQVAAAAALCAHEQELFWDMRDAMREEPHTLDRETLVQQAARIGLDTAQFTNCLTSRETESRIQAERDAGSEAGVYTPPALFINGRFLTGSTPYERLAKIIDDELSRSNS